MNKEIVIATVGQTVLEELGRLVMLVEAGNELLVDAVGHGGHNRIRVWWVVAQVVGEGVGVDRWVRRGELGDATGAANGNAKTKELARSGSS